MSTRTLSVALPASTLYVSGTVNGAAVTWTNTEGNTWEAVAERVENDIYRIELTIIGPSGTTGASLTLYHGLHLITDRTEADERRVEYLASKGWDSMTEDERAEWMAGMKGAYNASDLNRVGSAVEYVAGRFLEAGYLAEVEPKKDWTLGDIQKPEQLERYLADVAAVRGTIRMLPETPGTPERMTASAPGKNDGLDWSRANDIERILQDADLLITNMAGAYRHSGAAACGMEGLIR